VGGVGHAAGRAPVGTEPSVPRGVGNSDAGGSLGSGGCRSPGDVTDACSAECTSMCAVLMAHCAALPHVP
jgi:hypothetical protein